MTTNNEFKIESNVPIPKVGLGRRTKYPLGKMKVGESFFAPAPGNENIRTTACYFAKRHKGYRFTVAREGDGYRVWRIPAT